MQIVLYLMGLAVLDRPNSTNFVSTEAVPIGYKRSVKNLEKSFLHFHLVIPFWFLLNN